MVDAANLAQTLRIGREARQARRVIANPLLRSMAFAAPMPNPPTVSVATSTGMGAGSIRRHPEEFSFPGSRVYFDASFTQWVSAQNGNHRVRTRKSHGYAGDLTATDAAPKPGPQLMRVAGRIYISPSNTAGDFELIMIRNRALTRLWIDGLPNTAYPTDVTGGASIDNATIFVKYAGLTPGWHEIQWDLEQSLPGFLGLQHRAGDDFMPSQIVSKGKIMTLGDSIWQSGTALMGDPAPPNSQQYFSGGFVTNLGYLLGVRDFYGEYNQGGTGLVHDSGTGSVHFGARVADDIIPAAPDVLLIGCSSNDASTSGEAAQVDTALVAVVNQVRAALPECQIIGVGPLTVPPAPAWGGAVMTTVVQKFIAGCATAGIDYVDTSGIFTGTRLAGNAAAGDGNADMYVSALAADTAVNAPHPNQAGHDRIARFLAPKIARLLQIDMQSQPTLTSPTPSGFWEA